MLSWVLAGYGRLGAKAGNTAVFLSLPALDKSGVGQNGRLLIIEKLGVMETYVCMGPIPQPWGACFHLLFHICRYCSIECKPQVRLMHWVFPLFSQPPLSLDIGSPSRTGTLVFSLCVYKASSVAGVQEMVGE